jgi:glc operon protein GlcG
MTLTLADANRVIAGAIDKANQIGARMNIAAFGRPSGDLTPRADHPTLRGIAAAEGNHMFYGQGAVPIFSQGVLIGACGVGGGTAQEDEDCARAGVEKL